MPWRIFWLAYDGKAFSAFYPKSLVCSLPSSACLFINFTCGTLSDRAAMKSSATLSLLFLLPSIHALALPQLFDSPSTVERDLSARSPQGPTSNPGEFTGFDLSRANPANHPKHSGTAGTGGQEDVNTNGGSYDSPPSREVVMLEVAHHHNNNSSRHHRWNSTRHAHRKEGILTEFNAHGEHIVVYNGTHFPNGTSYSPANTTANGGTLLGEVVRAGDEIAVYRQPWNATRHHRHHHHHNQTVESNATPTTGIWLPSGTAWIPSSTGTGLPGRHHRKVPSSELAGFEGPKSRKKGKFVVVDEYFSKMVKSRK